MLLLQISLAAKSDIIGTALLRLVIPPCWQLDNLETNKWPGPGEMNLWGMWEGVQRARGRQMRTREKFGQGCIKIETEVDQPHGIPIGEGGIIFLSYESSFSWHFSFPVSFLLSSSPHPFPLCELKLVGTCHMER